MVLNKQNLICFQQMFQIWSLDNEAAFADLFIYFLKHRSPSYVHDMFGPFSSSIFSHLTFFLSFCFFPPTSAVVSEYFNASCIPGVGIAAPQLCALCQGQKSYVRDKNHFCETSSNEPFYDSEGAFRWALWHWYWIYLRRKRTCEGGKAKWHLNRMAFVFL